MGDLSSLEAIVDSGFTTRHEAASVGERIFRAHAAEASALASIPLVSRFKHAVEEAGLESILLSSRIDYAERLALSPGQLLDEEMHKLLHLCQQVLALQAFGYQAAPGRG